ncbi:MAG: hypothetical protein EXS55_03525 [Candidatus Magasanikbacteria bacterium]|nr:hypothetical protein [Candidatus Magasanikbacteria bacterium]
MGFFSFNKYPTVEHYLSEMEIKKIVSEVAVQTLKSSEEALVEQAVVARRHGDGKISLQQIYETLRSLVNKKKISKYDRDALMKRFVNHFKNS